MEWGGVRCDAERSGALRRGRAGARSYSPDRALSGSGGAAAPGQWEPRMTSSAGEAPAPGRGGAERRLQRLIRKSAGSGGNAALCGAAPGPRPLPPLVPPGLVQPLKN